MFTSRPLSKVDLLKLKPKDLIFYLQSKHISTTGCVEKEELVNLVLLHVNSLDGGTGAHHNHNEAENHSNTFDQLKQTCQNIFASVSEKLATDFNFETKSPQSSQSQNIYSQPRASPRPAQHDGQRYSGNFSTSTSFTSPHQSPASDQPPSSAASVPRSDSNVSNVSLNGPSSNNNRNPNVNRSNASSAGPTSPTSIHSFSSVGDNSSGRGDAGSTEQSKRKTAIPNTRNVRPTPMSKASVHIAARSDSDRSKFATNPLVLDINNSSVGCGSGCDCSDDEMIVTFQKSYSKTTSPVSDVRVMVDDQEAGPSGSSSRPTKTKEIDESSDASSFEELITSGNGVGAATSSDTENWQFVSKSTLADSSTQLPTTAPEHFDSYLSNNTVNPTATTRSQVDLSNLASTFPPPSQQQPQHHQPHSSDLSSSLQGGLPIRQLPRRRSDTLLYTSSSTASRRSLNYDGTESSEVNDGLFDGGGESIMSRKRTKTSCDKCGKNKLNLRRHVAKFKRQLESTNATEAEIKAQLDAFLEFLGNKNSVELSDSEGGGGGSGGGGPANEEDESVAGTPLSNGDRNFVGDTNSREQQEQNGAIEGDYYVDDDDNVYFHFGDDEGIHVYGSDDTSASSSRPTRTFINLSDYKEIHDLDELTVKQLKEILMLNRVDFKGCCEKTELLERVKRLWNEYNSCPAVDKLPSDDLCKICMDAPIECVILECGHMATCTSCGKVLSECPICRQYIVRVVRFFRA